MTPPTTSATQHLSEQDVQALGRELDAIRDEVLADLGEQDAAYIRGVIAAQRGLEAGGRGALLVSAFPPAWLAGTAMLSVAKILENLEIGHNVLHGQWDWMHDPDIHSATWEWDTASTADAWKHAHNFVHHTYTNVLGKDRDLGYAILRIAPDQPWHPIHLAQPVYIVPMALLFEWAIAIYDIELENVRAGRKPWPQARAELGGLWRKARKQLVKDYVAFPLLSGASAIPAFLGNLTANTIRNVWAHTIIVCGHFPDGAETFTEARLENESRGDWYIRQLLGSCNLDGPPLLHLMSGNLSFQIEHHLFPDLPSNRYAALAPRIREICERYGLPYTSGSLPRQYAQVIRSVLRLAFPGGGERDAQAHGRTEPAHDCQRVGRRLLPGPTASIVSVRLAPASRTSA